MIVEENEHVLRYETSPITIEISITNRSDSRDLKRKVFSLLEIFDRQIKEFLQEGHTETKE